MSRRRITTPYRSASLSQNACQGTGRPTNKRDAVVQFDRECDPSEFSQARISSGLKVEERSLMSSTPIIIRRSIDEGPGVVAEGTHLVIEDWPSSGTATEVAPLHVHHADDEAWHVISGALRFRFEDQELMVEAGSTVLVPAGVPHTFGNAGPQPSRFIIILSRRLHELISELHESDRSAHPAIYQKYESGLLE